MCALGYAWQFLAFFIHLLFMADKMTDQEYIQSIDEVLEAHREYGMLPDYLESFCRSVKTQFEQRKFLTNKQRGSIIKITNSTASYLAKKLDRETRDY